MEPGDPVPLGDVEYHRVTDILSEIYGAAKADNDTGRAMADKFCKEPKWTAKKIIPFSSATKWTGVVFEEQGSFLVGAPGIHYERPL